MFCGLVIGVIIKPHESTNCHSHGRLHLTSPLPYRIQTWHSTGWILTYCDCMTLPLTFLTTVLPCPKVGFPTELNSQIHISKPKQSTLLPSYFLSLRIVSAYQPYQYQLLSHPWCVLILHTPRTNVHDKFIYHHKIAQKALVCMNNQRTTSP